VERGVSGRGGDQGGRTRLAVGGPPHLPGALDSEEAGFGAPARHRAHDVLIPVREPASEGDDVPFEHGHRGEGGRVETVDGQVRRGSAGDELVQARNARVVDVGEHPAPVGGGIEFPQASEPFEDLVRRSGRFTIHVCPYLVSVYRRSGMSPRRASAAGRALMITMTPPSALGGCAATCAPVEETKPVRPSTTSAAVGPRAIPAVSPAVHTPEMMPPRSSPASARSAAMTSGSIASGYRCSPAQPTPAIATEAYTHGPAWRNRSIIEPAPTAKTRVATAKARRLPTRSASRRARGMRARAGATRATNRMLAAPSLRRIY